MKRRDLLTSFAGVAGGWMTLRFTVACSADAAEAEAEALGESSARDTVVDAGGGDADGGPDAHDAADGAPRPTVRLYDTNAVALYYDGSMGPYTGVILVSYILANVPVTLDFWHGHGGQQHRFTLLPAHFADLKKLKRVSIETSVVDGHTHTLFIDPVNPTYRVRGAPGVDVPL